MGVVISCRKMLGYHQRLPVALLMTTTKIGWISCVSSHSHECYAKQLSSSGCCSLSNRISRSSNGNMSDFLRFTILSRIFVASSCTRKCTTIFTSSGVFSGICQPAWLLPWYSDTRTRTFWLWLRRSRYCSQNQQMRLETPIFIGVDVDSDSRAFSPKVNSQW